MSIRAARPAPLFWAGALLGEGNAPHCPPHSLKSFLTQLSLWGGPRGPGSPTQRGVGLSPDVLGPGQRGGRSKSGPRAPRGPAICLLGLLRKRAETPLTQML